MFLLGNITALFVAAAYIGSAASLGSGAGRFLWPIWDVMATVPHAVGVRQHSWWFAVTAYLLLTFAPAAAVYGLFSMKSINRRLTGWSPFVKLTSCWAAQFGFFSVCAWVASGKGDADWLILAVLMLWLCPVALFCEELSAAERARRHPPRWVGEAIDRNPRFRFFCGFRLALLNVVGFACEGGWKEARTAHAYGTKSAASAEEANLL